MNRALLSLSILVLLAGCGIPARVRESVIAGEARARRAAELVRAGTASADEMKAYILGEEADWSAVRRAIEQP